MGLGRKPPPCRTVTGAVSTLLSVALIVLVSCQSLEAAGAVSECSLEIHGDIGLKGAGEATFTCTGGTVIAAVNGTLMRSFKENFTGIRWDKDMCGQPACLLTLCGDTTVKLTVNVTGITSPWQLDDMEVGSFARFGR